MECQHLTWAHQVVLPRHPFWSRKFCQRNFTNLCHRHLRRRWSLEFEALASPSVLCRNAQSRVSMFARCSMRVFSSLEKWITNDKLYISRDNPLTLLMPMRVVCHPRSRCKLLHPAERKTTLGSLTNIPASSPLVVVIVWILRVFARCGTT